MVTPSQPSQYYFISYCRQEVTFVDSFSRALEKRGIRNWVDFRQLVPGQPWQPQLDEGVKNSAAILLVTSKASMASASVKDEWTKSLADGKRIILIVFEPIQPDPDLTQLEWVDFTGDFDSAMKKLEALLAQPAQKTTSIPPQAGIRLPGSAKTFFGLSIVAAILAILGGYTVFGMVYKLILYEINLALNSILSADATTLEPNAIRSVVNSALLMSVLFLWIPAIWNFVKIPWQIRKRTHNAGQLTGALNSLFFANLFLFLTPLIGMVTRIWVDFDYETMLRFSQSYFYISVPLMLMIFAVCFVLYRLLISDSMYRWAGPTGAVIRVLRPDMSKHQDKVPPMRVAVEHAPQDKPYAEAFKASLLKGGHVHVENPQEADIVLPLLSAYKDKSSFHPEHTTMIPVLLQRCDVDPVLSQVQWVDLRYGQASIDAVVHLLHEPQELLRTLGVLPVRSPIFPVGVKRLNGALAIVLAISAVFTVASIMDHYTMERGGYFNFLILPGIYFLRRYIMDRKLKYLPFLSYWHIMGVAVVLAVLSLFAAWDPSVLFVPFIWAIPLLMLSKEVRMWMPAA